MFLQSLIILAALVYCDGLKILQIVPGFTNSHVLFNYRLAETLTNLGHEVKLLTQMEMNMVTGELKLPKNVSEVRVSIHFKDTLKLEGLKVFQTMIFNKGDAYDLWWTGQEFKDMRLESCEQMLNFDPNEFEKFKRENFDLAIGHFHDLCPLAIAGKIEIKKVAWITHGPSIYDFTAIQMGLRTIPSFVPHPLSSQGDTMTFFERIVNLAWHFSGIDFVNLPTNLLYDENAMYRKKYINPTTGMDLWDLSQRVNVLFVNGERFLDFPRPLPLSMAFMGEVGQKPAGKSKISPEIEAIVQKARKGIVIFSLGTVSNTSSMPKHMATSFVEAFGQFPDYEFLWRMETELPEASKYKNIHLLRWLPQKDLMSHPKTKLLIAHGGFNSFLEASKAGIPVILMPLFADQFINAKRAKRFEFGEVLDKLSLSADVIAEKIRTLLDDSKYASNAKKLSAMLSDRPTSDLHAILKHRLKLLISPRDYYALKASQKLNFFQFFNLDLLAIVLLLPLIMISIC